MGNSEESSGNSLFERRIHLTAGVTVEDARAITTSSDSDGKKEGGKRPKV